MTSCSQSFKMAWIKMCLGAFSPLWCFPPLQLPFIRGSGFWTDADVSLLNSKGKNCSEDVELNQVHFTKDMTQISDGIPACSEQSSSTLNMMRHGLTSNFSPFNTFLSLQKGKNFLHSPENWALCTAWQLFFQSVAPDTDFRLERIKVEVFLFSQIIPIFVHED